MSASTFRKYVVQEGGWESGEGLNIRLLVPQAPVLESV
jgi:hypothetical protein